MMNDRFFTVNGHAISGYIVNGGVWSRRYTDVSVFDSFELEEWIKLGLLLNKLEHYGGLSKKQLKKMDKLLVKYSDYLNNQRK